jgi:UDP-N-acetylmuramoyl-tripeptide--D-alanyl-D-alanine ligase
MILKKIGKAFLCRMLEAQVKQLRRRNDFRVVAIAGSVGKTSTKLAIAKLLASRKSVIYQDGNYNDRLTVPLVLFGQAEPGIFDITAWIRLLLSNRRSLKRPYAYDIAVVELGTDAPGQLSRFAYLKPDLLVITAVAPEHMEFFGNLEAVAKEELAPFYFSKQALLNLDDIDAKYLPDGKYASYGEEQDAQYKLVESAQHGLQSQQLKINLNDKTDLSVSTPLLGKTGAKIVLAATAVADMLGWTAEYIKSGTDEIQPVAGRMRVLQGVSDTQLIDDTYNSSPSAAIAALDVLYQTQTAQRICIFGSMNELGELSPEAHKAVGAYCDPDKLDLVVTIGAEAQKYLIPAAQAKGCQVKAFMNPYEAGAYVRQSLKSGAVVLAKGSQNKVFAEEALKTLLRNPADAKLLVRQSPYWLKIKKQQFPQQAGD